MAASVLPTSSMQSSDVASILIPATIAFSFASRYQPRNQLITRRTWRITTFQTIQLTYHISRAPLSYLDVVYNHRPTSPPLGSRTDSPHSLHHRTQNRKSLRHNTMLNINHQPVHLLAKLPSCPMAGFWELILRSSGSHSCLLGFCAPERNPSQRTSLPPARPCSRSAAARPDGHRDECLDPASPTTLNNDDGLTSYFNELPDRRIHSTIVNDELDFVVAIGA